MTRGLIAVTARNDETCQWGLPVMRLFSTVTDAAYVAERVAEKALSDAGEPDDDNRRAYLAQVRQYFMPDVPVDVETRDGKRVRQVMCARANIPAAGREG